MYFPTVDIALPHWVETALPDAEYVYPTEADRMSLVIELARKNVNAGTGGPFGAGIFEMESGRLVSPGVNTVIPGNCSVAHAEITAIMVAQKNLGTHDLGGVGLPPMELVSSTEPCTMCLGAVVWSGVRRLVCGARDSDVRAIGFDEGPKPDNWPLALETRGISVARDVARYDARAVLRHYVDSGGLVYNARQAV